MLATLSPGNGGAFAGARIQALADEFWEGCLRDSPVTATAIGDRRFDHLLDDGTPEAREREMLRLGRLRHELFAPEIAPDRLPAAEVHRPHPAGGEEPADRQQQPDPAAVKGGDAVQDREVQESQLAGELGLHLVAGVRVQPVPLVDGYHQCTAAV